MAKANDDAPIASEADDNYERAKDFLSGWIENSTIVPPATATARPQPPRRPSPQSSEDVPLPKGRLRRRRITVSNDDCINSLANSLHTSIMLNEHQNQNRPTQHGSRDNRPCVSPTFSGTALQKESSPGRGTVPPLPFSIQPQQPSASPPGSRRREYNRRRSCDDAPPIHVKNQREYSRRRSCDDAPPPPEYIKKYINNQHEYTRRRSCDDAPPENIKKYIKKRSEYSRRRSCDDAPPPIHVKNQHEYSRRRSCDDAPSGYAKHCHESKKHRTLPGPNFDLGDTLRSTEYQIIESSPTKAVHLVQQLRIHDFAWVRRSSNEWTYGIVADFPEPKHGEEASILFVIDKLGHTKTFKMKYWATCIRLVDDTVIYC